MYRYQIYKTEKMVVMQFSGEAGFSDMVACFNECASDPDYSPSYNGVADIRQLKLAFTVPEIKGLAAYVVANHLSEGKWAVLVNEPTDTALAFVYAAEVSCQHPISIFYTIEAASNFLGNPLVEFLL
jgi:hypothetical protein